MSSVDETIAARANVHGDYADMARVYDSIMDVVCAEQADVAKVPEHGHAMVMIVTKLARIVCGDPNHADHWHDIAGYATLAEKACRQA